MKLKPYDRIEGATSGKEGRIDVVLGGKQEALALKANEFVRFVDKKTGKIRVERGEQGCVVPLPNEEPYDRPGSSTVIGGTVLTGGKRVSPELSCAEYIRILDKNTGKVRVVRGEGVVSLNASEEF